MRPSESLSKLRSSDSLEIHLLGLVDFDSATGLQQQLADEIAQRADRRGVLLICEHPPVVTVGREGRPADLLWEPAEFVARQIPLQWLSRGGGVIAHSPGQLACYPIVPLSRIDLSPANLKMLLELAVIDVCRELKLPTYVRADRPGVWCRNGRLAETGLCVENHVSSHGLYLNVSNELPMQHLVQLPRGERVTSLAVERHSGSLMHNVRTLMIERLSARLGYSHFHVSTGHPRLHRVKKKVSVHA